LFTKLTTIYNATAFNYNFKAVKELQLSENLHPNFEEMHLGKVKSGTVLFGTINSQERGK